MPIKLRTSQKMLLTALLVAFILVGAIASLVIVLAAPKQDTTTSVDVGFVASDVAGTVKFSYKVGSGAFSEPKIAEFSGHENTTNSGNLSPDAKISFDNASTAVVFRYEITGHAVGGYNLSFHYRDTGVADENSKLSYALSTSEISDFSGLNPNAPAGTIFANEHKGDLDKVYLYVKMGARDIVLDLVMNGDFTLVLSREEWVDPNFDASTGISYGYVENSGDPYAVTTNYSGSATQLNINTTSVYGVAMPVRTIADYSFAAQTNALATSTLLTKITVGENVERIDGYAFANNTSLTEATISNWVSHIATTAFYNCPNLGKITNSSPVEITPGKFGLPAGVQIDTPLAMRVEDETFNGRHYYYVEMGEYPQTFVGYADQVTGLTETSEKFILDLTKATDAGNGSYIADYEFNIWVDIFGYRYIKHLVNPAETCGTFMDGTVPVVEESYFKIEPIVWDIYGYYTDDTKTSIIRVVESNFDKNHKENLIVSSRFALQAMQWYPINSDYNYTQTNGYKWFRSLEKNILSEYLINIETVSNPYNDTSENTLESIQNGNVVIEGYVDEKVWTMDYNQANYLYAGGSERRCAASDFALATYAFQSVLPSYNTIGKLNGGTTNIWLRSSCVTGGGGSYNCTLIYDWIGGITDHYIWNTYRCVRPSMLINL